MNKDELGELIRRHRKNRNWTQQELADKAGLTKDLIYRMERNKGSIGNNAYQAIADIFDIPIPIVIMPKPAAKEEEE